MPALPEACLSAVLSAAEQFREQREKNTEGEVPRPLAMLRELLQTRAHEEGLFRVSGEQANTKQAKDETIFNVVMLLQGSARVVHRLAVHCDEGELLLGSATATADAASLFKVGLFCLFVVLLF
jgi:hypothetical protein